MAEVGAEQTRIINYVLAKLFRRFYGDRGLVLTAFSNKASRLIKGKTSHTLTKLLGGQSLTMAQLRVQSDTERRALAAVWAPARALVKDEFTQQPRGAGACNRSSSDLWKRAAP